jgi:hypothetical protein
VAYAWNKEKISVEEILAILYEQYNQNPSISVPISDGNKQFDYKHALLPVRCNRCGNAYQISAQLLLSMKEDRGYCCSKCGNMTDVQLQEYLRKDRLNAGRELLENMGIDPEVEDDEEKEKRLREEEENSLMQAMLSETNELIDQKEIISEEEANNLINPKEIILEKEANESSSPTQPEPIIDYTVIIDDKEIDRIKDSTKDLGPMTVEYPEEIDKSVEDDSSDEEDIEFDDIFNEAELSNNGLETDDEEQVISSIDPNELFTSEESISSEDEDDIEYDDEKQVVHMNGKDLNIDELTKRFDEIQHNLKNKLGYVPYKEPIVVKDWEGLITVTCNICHKEFDVRDVDVLENNILKLDKKACIEYGLKYKGDITISSCPHCKKSILANGFNKYYREKVEANIATRKLNIVRPESYWYASPNAIYNLEANGVVRSINYIDIRNKYSGIDMSKHELFAPRGNAVKSEATSVDKDEGNSFEGSFRLPDHEPNSQFHVDAGESSPEPMFERHQKQAESQQVFRKNEKFEKDKENIAKLNGLENPFERESKLDVAFTKTIFYSFIKELAEECKVRYRFEINQKTFEIPVVDFEPYEEGKQGFRLVCADYSRNTMFNVPFNRIATSIPFMFKVNVNKGEKQYNYSVLYSDSITYRERATLFALVKYINPTVLAYGGNRIQLEGNLNVQYTDYQEYLREFSEDNSPFPDGKAKNRELGILASWVSSKDYDAKDILETLSSLDNNRMNDNNLKKLESDMGMYMVCSIKYIRQINRETNRVCYTITEYVESGDAIIADGLFQCVRAILKEYYLDFPNMRDKVPSVVVEVDPNSYTSPSLRNYIEKKSLLPMDNIYRTTLEGSNPNNIYSQMYAKPQHLRYVYVRKNEFRNKGNDRDFMRRDIRKFNAVGLKRMMPEEIMAAGMQSGIEYDNQRLVFIANMGFSYATQLETKEFFFNSGIIQRILLDGQTILMAKAVNPDSVFNNGGIVSSSDNSINTINNPMFNPIFRSKMERIRSGHITPEANDFYKSYMMQKQQEMYNNNGMGMSFVPNNVQPFPGMWQNPTPGPIPTMTQGAYYRPHMPGMNNY